MTKRVALIVGAGPGISAAFGEALVADWRRDYDRYRFDRFPRERWYRR